jgi:hypothetical protein
MRVRDLQSHRVLQRIGDGDRSRRTGPNPIISKATTCRERATERDAGTAIERTRLAGDGARR